MFFPQFIKCNLLIRYALYRFVTTVRRWLLCNYTPWLAGVVAQDGMGWDEMRWSTDSADYTSRRWAATITMTRSDLEVDVWLWLWPWIWIYGYMDMWMWEQCPMSSIIASAHSCVLLLPLPLPLQSYFMPPRAYIHRVFEGGERKSG